MAQFFDFERHWSEFFRIWGQADVQQQAQRDLRESGVFELRQNERGWAPGGTLWQLSPGRYVTDVVDRLVRADREFVGAALEAPPDRADELYARWAARHVRPGALHAYVLPEAAACLSRAMLMVARRMFPRDAWYHVAGDHHSTVVSASPRNAVLFDLWLFHAHRYAGGPCAAVVLAAVGGRSTRPGVVEGLHLPPPFLPTPF